MFKVAALSVLLAAMGIGNTFANPMDIDFNTMDLAVNKGTNEVYSVRFDVNLANFVTEFECDAILKGHSMDVSIFRILHMYLLHGLKKRIVHKLTYLFSICLENQRMLSDLWSTRF